MAAGSFSSILSTRLPASFSTVKVPPTTLALPGPVQAVVTPPRSPLGKAPSWGLMESMARSWGVRGSTTSL